MRSEYLELRKTFWDYFVSATKQNIQKVDSSCKEIIQDEVLLFCNLLSNFEHVCNI